MSAQKPASVLVVDDEASNREILQRRLERAGYLVKAAQNGRQALKMLETQPFDLVLLDIMMPGMSGLEVLDSIRSTRSLCDLPVIMATAQSDSGSVVDALERGANDYVSKPLDFPVVLARVKTQLAATARRDGSQTVLRTKIPESAPLRRLEQAYAETARGAAVGSTPVDAMEGQILTGKYRVECLIGKGGCGAVYRARHMRLHRTVAIKVLRVQVETKDSVLTLLQREAISACRIAHRNAVEIYDIDIASSGVPYMVMEFLEGRSLRDELKKQGPRPLARCAEVLIPVCDVLAKAHRLGILHRDVKPENIFLQRGGGGETVKVVDFGLAKIIDEALEKGAENLSGRGWLNGTPAYMAPERWRGLPYDGNADVYSLGVTLFVMLTGKLPFEEASDMLRLAMMHMREPPARLRDHCPEVPEEVEEIVMQALQKEPECRPSLADMAHGVAAEAGMAVDRNVYQYLSDNA
jgi:DNA-binding response OmpR family regulator